MESTLQTLEQNLRASRETLRQHVKGRSLTAPEDDGTQPSHETIKQAATIVDLMQDVGQMLEPPATVLADYFLGYVQTKCLCAAVALNVPDVLQDGPLSLKTLATKTDARVDRLRQVLRALSGNGIFHYDATQDSCSNNATSELLRSDHWSQWRNWVDLYGNEFYDMARGIPDCCRAGTKRSAAQMEFDTDQDMFTYFNEQGWGPRLHRTLAAGARAQIFGIANDYPWHELEGVKFLDVGGGSGGLIASVLDNHKTLQAALLDRDRIVELARKNFHSADGAFAHLGDRIAKDDLIVGDFLTSIPPFEAYVMKWCLHDWDDDNVVKILKNIRAAIVETPKSRLVVFESILRDERSARLSRYADINMMMTAGGQERDAAKWKELAEASGWHLRHIYDLRGSWPSAIELVVANASSALQNGTNGIVSTQDKPLKFPEYVDPIESAMSFLEPWDESKGEPYFRGQPDEGFASKNFGWTEHNVTVRDGRHLMDTFNFDDNGFKFVKDPSEVDSETLAGIRRNDAELVKARYYPHIRDFMKRETGAKRVIIFDHTVRRRNPELDSNVNKDGQEQPATIVHCDQGPRGAKRRLEQNLDAEDSMEKILEGRVQLVNAWKPLCDTVVDWPLAVMDMSTMSKSDMHFCNLWRHQYEDRGQTVTFVHNEDQRWYYLREQQSDEMTLIKIWDSSEKVKAQHCAHCAFKHPQTPAGAPPRESIEVRCILIYE